MTFEVMQQIVIGIMLAWIIHHEFWVHRK